MSTASPSKLSIEPGGTYLDLGTGLWGHTVLVGTQEIAVEPKAANKSVAIGFMDNHVTELRALYEKVQRK